jgi:hypothetical protein
MITQRQKLQEFLQYNMKDNPLLVEVKRLRVVIHELKQENSGKKYEIEV